MSIPEPILEAVEAALSASGAAGHGVPWVPDDAPLSFAPDDLTPTQRAVLAYWEEWGVSATPALSLLGFWDGRSFLCRVPTGRRMMVPAMCIVGRGVGDAETIARAWVTYCWASIDHLRFREDSPS